MKVAFYKNNKKRIFNRIVSWWTRGPYSHTELVLDNGLSFSSSGIDHGVRYKRIEFNPENWDLVEIGPQTPEITARLVQIEGKKYDYLGLIGFVVRRVGDDRNKMFCSESVAFALGFDEPWRFDPNTLASVVRRMGNGA